MNSSSVSRAAARANTTKRFNLPVAEARLPYANHFELNLTKIKTLLGFNPRHDFDSILTTAEAVRRGEDTDVIPTGIRYGAD